MARTYWAEGRNISKSVSGLLILISLYSWFQLSKLLSLHWLYLIALIFISIIIGEISGRAWTNYRRANKSKRKRIAPITYNNKDTSKATINKNLSDKELLSANIDTLSGTDFEKLIEMYYKDKGYQVQRIGGAGDHEVDLILQGKEGYKIAVQCKRWKKNVGNDIVLRLKAGKQVHGCYDAWIVTTSHFTRKAQEAADSLNIRLISGLMVHDMINNWRKQKMKIV